MQCIDTVLGMIALNSASCKPGEEAPIVYTKIEMYLDWIEEKIWPKQPKPADLLLRSAEVKLPVNITEVIPPPTVGPN